MCKTLIRDTSIVQGMDVFLIQLDNSWVIFDIKVQIVSLCFNVNALYEKIFDKNRDTFWLTDEETDEMKKIFRKNYKGIMNL